MLILTLALAQWDLAMLERDYAAAEKILTDSPSENFPLIPESTRKHFTRAASPSLAATSNRPNAILPRRRQPVEKRVRDAPDNANVMPTSDCSTPTCRGKRMPFEKVVGPSNWSRKVKTHFMARLRGNLALVYALAGEPDQAITLIERLLSTPGAVGSVMDFP